MEQIKHKEELDDAISQDGLTIVKVGASWCQPCKMLERTITDIEPTVENVKFYEIDVDDVDESVIDGYQIQSVPVLLFFNEGLVVDRVLGNIPKSMLLDKIEKNK